MLTATGRKGEISQEEKMEMEAHVGWAEKLSVLATLFCYNSICAVDGCAGVVPFSVLLAPWAKAAAECRHLGEPQ